MGVLQRASVEFVAVLLLVTLSERLYSDTDRHYYTLSCFHFPSMKCHSIFNVPSRCFSSIALQFFRLCLVTLFLLSILLIFVFISLPSYFPASPFTLAIFLPCLSLSPFFQFPSLCFTQFYLICGANASTGQLFRLC